MATVRIGEKTLRVLEPHEAGSFYVDHLVMKKQKEIAEASVEESPLGAHRRLAELIFCFVGGAHNPDVTIDWLISALPGQVTPLVQECMTAASQRRKEPAAGEASRP